MAKNRQKKRKHAAKAGDVEMAPESAGEAWMTGTAGAPLHDHPMSLDELISINAQKSKKAKAKENGGIKMKPNGGVGKKAARGQRSKAQKLRKLEKLEKALAATDKYSEKCNKKEQTKTVKTTLANIY